MPTSPAFTWSLALDSFVLPVNYGAAELDSRRRQFFEQLAPQVREKFDNAARRYGVTAEWRQLDGKSDLLADTMLDHAIYADLIVAGQVSNNNERSTVEADFIERLLLGSGRPVLDRAGSRQLRTDRLTCGHRLERHTGGHQGKL